MDPFVRIFGDSQFHVMCAIITWTAALYCLLALWAATSRRHWFLRGAVVLAVGSAVVVAGAARVALVAPAVREGERPRNWTAAPD